MPQDLEEAFEIFNPSAPEVVQPEKPAPVATPAGGDAFEEFMSGAGVSIEKTVPAIWKPWMKHHEFKLVMSADELD